MTIIWTDPAFEDLNSIHQYIAKDFAFYASRLIDRILKRVEQLENHPKSGRVVPEFEIETLRELIEGNYRIIYKINADHIGIVRVHHEKMLLTHI